MVRIDFIYREECPSHSKAWERLHNILQETGVHADVKRIEIQDEEAARGHTFHGSPTIRINGRDIDPGDEKNQPVGLNCRIYHDDSGRVTPLPPENLIRIAIQRANRKEE